MIDTIERDAAGAGQVHLQRAGELIRDLAHQLDLAAASSDLCAIPPNAVGLIGKLAWEIASTHQNAKTQIAKGVSLPIRIREVGNIVYLLRDAT